MRVVIFTHFLQKANDFGGVKYYHSLTFDLSKSMSLTPLHVPHVLLLLQIKRKFYTDAPSVCPITAGVFEDEDIIHVEGTVDPVRDMEIIHEELRLKDEEMIIPIIDKLEKTAIRGGDKKLKPEYVSRCPSRPIAPPHS